MLKTVEITGFDERGKGLADGMAVPYAYPGDIVEVEPANKKAGRIISVVTPSKHRQTPPCKYFGDCGGCPWQGLNYQSQLRFKEERIKELFGECLPIIPSPEEYFYRNRMDFAFGPNYSIGLKGPNNNVIDLETCHLMSQKCNKILGQVKGLIRQYGLKEHETGIMRHLLIREGRNIKNTVLNFITSDKGELPLEKLWEGLKDAVDGISWSINLSPADRSYGKIMKTIGQGYLMESLGGLKFQIPVQSFFQTNTLQAEQLLAVIGEAAGLSGDEAVLDLYTGTGSIGLSLAHRAGRVFGIEENKPAVELSLFNAQLNRVKNYAAIAGRVEQVIGDLAEDYGLVVLDPPRPGVGKKVIRKIADRRPQKIIYVSCNPYTQKQDIQILKENGYKIHFCLPLDMFPHTPHIENVILLIF